MCGIYLQYLINLRNLCDLHEMILIHINLFFLGFHIFSIRNMQSSENKTGNNSKNTNGKKCIAKSVVWFAMNKISVFKNLQDNQTERNPETDCQLLVDG